jgi:hypothetical protein
LKKCLILALIISLIIIGTLSVSTSAIAPVLTLYETYLAGGDGDSAVIWGVNWSGMQFTTGTTCHSVSRIDLSLKRTGTTPGTVTVELYAADAAHLPTGSVLTTGTISGNALGVGYSTVPVSVIQITLSSSTEYCIVVKAVAGDVSNYINWQMDTGGSLANAVASKSVMGGLVWTSETPADNLFSVYGYPAMSIIRTTVHEDYITAGDMLIVAECLNTYEPYYSANDNTKSYFEMRLYDVAGTTLLAMSNYSGWGDRPQSIYLGTALAGSLTVSSACIVRIYGLFAPNPIASYTLTSADWQGSNMSKLDDRILSIARNIERYTSTILLVSVSGIGDQLNSTGAVIFDAGIPSLRKMRPLLYNISQVQTTIDTHIPASNFNTTPGMDYRTTLGDKVADFLDDTADIVGLPSGKDFGAIFGFIIYLVIAIFAFGKGQFTVGLGLAFPVLGLGAYFRLLDIQWLIGIVVIFAVLFTWSFWWSRT